jgi:hypothetical protein
MAAVVVGFVGVAGLALIAVLASDSSLVLGIIAVFAGIQCYSGYRQAKFLRHLEEAPRQPDYACPSCQAHPPIGPYWGCPSCRIGFDTFYTEGQCPRCRSVYSMTQCLDCGANSPFAQWTAAPSRAEGAGTY